MTSPDNHKVLMITPHFAPDSGAAAHRVRLLAPHLPDFGWTPTVLTVDPRFYEGRLDDELCKLLPGDLRVVRCKALPVSLTRWVGIGDLGLRAWYGLYRAAIDILSEAEYSALFITVYPTYPALLGPRLKRRFGIPFILDYQDPWVGAWGDSVGPGPGGMPDLKSRFSRRLAASLEPLSVHAADALTAVSAATYEQVVQRNPSAAGIPVKAIPIGGEPLDFAYLRANPRPNEHFHVSDGLFHVCHVGTILPLGVESLRAFLKAAKVVKDTRPDMYRRLRIHFFGTGNQTTAGLEARVVPHAAEIGVADCVTEERQRIGYLDALNVQAHSSALLLLGSSEYHYTASRLFPALLAGPPIIAAYHEKSSVSEILRTYSRDYVRLVEYNEESGPETHIGDLARDLVETMQSPPKQQPSGAEAPFALYTAKTLAGELAEIMDRVRRD